MVSESNQMNWLGRRQKAASEIFENNANFLTR
jgi:hypothetical protein